MSSKTGVKLTGFESLNAQMAKFADAEQDKVRKGVQKASMFIKGESQQLTPVDFGVLRASAYYSTDINYGYARGRVGYTAEYAPWVHEMPMKLKGEPRADFGTTRSGVSFGGGSSKGYYWDSGENKFLEKAISRNTKTIIRLIAKEAEF